MQWIVQIALLAAGVACLMGYASWGKVYPVQNPSVFTRADAAGCALLFFGAFGVVGAIAWFLVGLFLPLLKH